MGGERRETLYCEKCGKYVFHDADLEVKDGAMVHRVCGTRVSMMPDSPGDQYD